MKKHVVETQVVIFQMFQSEFEIFFSKPYRNLFIFTDFDCWAFIVSMIGLGTLQRDATFLALLLVNFYLSHKQTCTRKRI